MSNPHKGDVPFEVDGKTYTLRYSHSALVKLEQQLDKGMMRIMRDIENAEEMRIGTVAALLWAGLQKHHPKTTMDDACDLLDEMEGGTAAVVNIVGEAFQKAFNAPGSTGTNPPQRAANGTGIVSSSSMPASATSPTPSGTSRPEN